MNYEPILIIACRGNSASCVELMSRLYYGGGSACQSILATSPPHYPFDLVNVGVSIDAKRVSSTQNIHRNNRATRQESSQSKVSYDLAYIIWISLLFDVCFDAF